MAPSVKLYADEAILEEKRAAGLVQLQDLSMKAVTPDVAYQARVEQLNKDHVAYLERVLIDGGTLAPVVVFRFADGTMKVVDGFHRWDAYRRFKAASIPALIVEGTSQEAIEYAAAANQRASLGRKKEDVKRAAFMLFENGWFRRSGKWVSSHIGTSTQTVTKWRAEYAAITGLTVPSQLEDILGRPVQPYSKHPVLRSRRNGKPSGWVEGREASSESAFQAATADLEFQARRLARGANLRSSLSYLGIHTLQPRENVLATAGICKAAGAALSFLAAMKRESAVFRVDVVQAVIRAHFAREYFGTTRAVVLVVSPPDADSELAAFAAKFSVEILTFDEFVESVAPASKRA